MKDKSKNDRPIVEPNIIKDKLSLPTTLKKIRNVQMEILD